jgi:hypothetical protein
MIRASEDWIYIYGPGDESLWTIHAPTPSGSSWTETFTLRGLGAEVLREYELVGSSVSGIWNELGTPRLWTGPTGQIRKRPEHLPYGEPAVSSAQKLQFTGHERDARGQAHPIALATRAEVSGYSTVAVKSRIDASGSAVISATHYSITRGFLFTEIHIAKGNLARIDRRQ